MFTLGIIGSADSPFDRNTYIFVDLKYFFETDSPTEVAVAGTLAVLNLFPYVVRHGQAASSTTSRTNTNSSITRICRSTTMRLRNSEPRSEFSTLRFIALWATQ